MELSKLSVGDSGEEVSGLHEKLALHGVEVSPEEQKRKFFGPSTRAALAEVQKAQGLETTGEVNKETAKILISQPPAISASETATATTFLHPTETVAAAPPTIGAVIPLPPPHPGPSAPDSKVAGRILLDHGLPADGVALRFYHKDFGGEVQLGETRTDGQGAYALSYNSLGKAVNLEVRVVDSTGKETPLSETKFSVTKDESLNLVAPASVQPLAAEYQRLSADVGGRIGGIANLSLARETGERQDLTLLNQSTGWDARLISLAANANKISSETGIPQEPLYGLYRAGLPTDKQQLALLSIDTIEKALNKVKEAGIVNLSDEQVATTKSAFETFARTTRLALKTPGQQSSFGEMLNRAGSTEAGKLTDVEKNTFADLYFSHEGTPAELWQKARGKGIAETKIASLQMQGKLSYLTLNNAELAASLQSEIGSTDNLAQLVDKDLYKKDVWKSRLTEQTVPPAYDGEKASDRIDNYAEDLARKVRLSFPTQVVARMVEKDELHLGDDHAALKAPVSTFLRNAVAKGYDLGRMPLRTFINQNRDSVFKGIAEADVEATTKKVETIHRLYQVTPSNEALSTVMGLGFTSAHDIARVPYQSFIDLYGDRFPSRDHADIIHRQSEQITVTVHNFFLSAKQLELAPPVQAMSVPPAIREEAKNQLIKQYPTIESLFGSLDFCECEHCRSVLSPAAYLVDLLHFLDPKDTEWNTALSQWKNTHSGTPYPFRDEDARNAFLSSWRTANPGKPDPAGEKRPFDVLVERRPDLPHLPLTCENTNTALPYIDVVNEILEYYVAKETLDEQAVYDTGSATTAELLAEPQNVTPAAYEKLKSANYPLGLPFDLWLETVRQFFEQSETSLWKVLEQLRPADELFPPAINQKAYYRASIFAEYLRLSPAEYAIFTAQNPLADWFKLYGYASETDALAALQSAKNLSRRLGVSYKTLVDIVQTGFVNPRLEALVILRKLNIDVQDMLRFKEQGGQPSLSAEDKAAVESRIAELEKSLNLPPGSAKEQLETAWKNANLSEILLLVDPHTGCNFDMTSLHYADGKVADALAYLKINLFVRLWKKLGWTVAETDRALQVFLPAASLPLTGANLSGAMTSALIYLAHLKALTERVKVGKDSRIKLLTLWSNMATMGRRPLYEQLFLKRSILKNDAVFDDPIGAYLSKPNLPLKEHVLAIQSALNLTADEIKLILADNGLDAESANLSITLVSLSYRHGLFARALKLSVRELIVLKGLSGFDPFKQLSPAPLTSLSEDHPFNQTLGFVEIAEQVRASGFKVEDLEYLFRHRIDPVGKYRADTEASLGLARNLASGIRRIQIEQAIPEDAANFTDDALRQKLSMVMPAEVAETFMAMWLGTKEFEATSSTPVAPDDSLKPEAFASERDIRVSYDHTNQHLAFRGVLLDDRKVALKTAFPSLLVGSLLDAVQTKARDFFTKYLLKSAGAEEPVTGFLEAVDFELLFAPIADSLSDAVRQGKLREKRQKLANAFLPFVQQRLIRQFVLQTLESAFPVDAGLVETLISHGDLLSDPKQLHQPLFDAFAGAANPGASVSFFTSADATGPTVKPPGITLTVDTSGKPDTASSARFQGYLEVPASGAYRFFIRLGKQNAQAELHFDHLGKDPLLRGVATADGSEITNFTELTAGVPYAFTLEARNLGGGDVSLSFLSQEMPKGSLDRLVLFPQAVVELIGRAWILLSKTLQLVQGFGLSDHETRYLLSHSADFGGLDLSKLPTSESEDSPIGANALFAGFLRLANYARLKRALAEGSDDLITLFEGSRRSYLSTTDVNQAKNSLLDDVYQSVAAMTRRDPETVRAISDSLGFAVEQTMVGNELRLTIPAFVNEKGIDRLFEVMQIVEQLGVPVTAIVRWATPSPDFEVARDLKDTVKARYEEENWQRIAQPIFDRLRQRQRDALVAYVIHRHGFDRVEQLFEYFLIDPAMEPVVQTSRLRLAISSVQTFIQRCLLNLEPQVHPSTINSQHWQWMKRYRVWEANRRIWLFPENWLEPEFRDDKTYLFRELEGALLEGDVSNDLVEDAFLRYLKELEELAHLDIVAMYCDEKSEPESRVLYVIGRTHNLPHKYFYRRNAHQMWTPWEKVTVDIEGDHIAAVIWRERLHLFWLTFMEKAEHDPSAGSSINDNATIGQVAKSISTITPLKKVEVQLNWTELLQGDWTPRKSSGFVSLNDSPVVSNFTIGGVSVYPYKEIEDNEERAIRINLAGQIDGAFRLVSKNSPPKPASIAPLWPIPYSAATPSATQYQFRDQLEVVFFDQIKTEDGKVSKDLHETGKQILRQGLSKGQAYSLLTCTDLLAIDTSALDRRFPDDNFTDSQGRLTDRGRWFLNEFLPNSLTIPFFYQDDHHSFFVEPTLTETTIDRWDEWVIGFRPTYRDIEVRSLLDTVPLVANVPLTRTAATLPSEIDPAARFKLDRRTDWATHASTLIKFDDRLIGHAGGIDPSRVTVSNLSQVGVAAATTSGEASVSLSGSVPVTEVVLPGSVTIVGDAGLNTARLENMKTELRTSAPRRLINTGIAEGFVSH